MFYQSLTPLRLTSPSDSLRPLFSSQEQGDSTMKAAARVLIALILGLLVFGSVIQHPPAAKAAPLDLSGEINGAPYHIRVPDVWNGTLLIFAHGYRDKADHPGEIDDRSADDSATAGLIAPLLAQGFALAST